MKKGEYKILIQKREHDTFFHLNLSLAQRLSLVGYILQGKDFLMWNDSVLYMDIRKKKVKK